MSPPAVTIVVPTFNRAAWLRGAIDSVLSQDYGDLELLVVDDGSTDETPDVLSEYEARYDRSRLRVLEQENAGQANAINRGWALARGQVLGYLSDDDLLADGAVSRLVEELVADPDCVVAYPGYHIIDADDGIIDTIRPIEYSPREANRLHDTIIGPGGLIRRSAIDDAGGWSAELHWIGDLILWMRLGLLGRVARVVEPLALWRRHAEAATAQVGIGHAREHVRVAELGIDLLGREAVDSADQAEALRNACILGSFFGGDLASSPGARYAAIDLQRPEISAFGAGMPPTEMPGAGADEAARLWRRLAVLTTELGALRAPGAPEPDGLDAARDLLERVGVRDGHGAGADSPLAVAEVRAAMMEAALHCGADSGIERNRFLLIDTADGTVTQQELDELLALGMSCSHEALRDAIARRTKEVERLRA